MSYERMDENITDEAAWHTHRYRYMLAGTYTKQTDVVLDAACGIGYGSEFLSGVYVGVDKHPVGEDHIEADLVDWTPSFEYDVFISFETIEHLTDYTNLVALAKDAKRLVIVSAPIVPTVGYNPHHLHDFTMDSLRALFEDAEWRVSHSEVQDGKYGIFVLERV